MAVTEWRPRNVPGENRLLREVTRFFGSQLQDIGTKVTSWLQTHPESTRDQAVSQLAKTEKEANRIQLGLDVLNQLSVIDRDGNDVQNIIVREDTKSTIQKDPPGQHHYYYEIDWINEPDEKPTPPPAPVVQAHTQKPVYPFKTAAEQAAEKAAFQRRRQSQLERRLEDERIQDENEAIREVIIDRGRELGEECMEGEVMRIELGDDGIAVILRSTAFGDLQVNRQNGRFGEELFLFADQIRRDVLAYVEVLAKKLEGREVDEYSPDQLDPQVIEDTYERAIRHKMLLVERSPETGIVEFYYLSYSDIVDFTHYERIDLGRMVVELSNDLLNKKRPIRPQFVEFLRQKKAELEGALVKS